MVLCALSITQDVWWWHRTEAIDFWFAYTVGYFVYDLAPVRDMLAGGNMSKSCRWWWRTGRL